MQRSCSIGSVELPPFARAAGGKATTGEPNEACCPHVDGRRRRFACLTRRVRRQLYSRAIIGDLRALQTGAALLPVARPATEPMAVAPRLDEGYL